MDKRMGVMCKVDIVDYSVSVKYGVGRVTEVKGRRGKEEK
jgi:hypothetical protein